MKELILCVLIIFSFGSYAQTTVTLTSNKDTFIYEDEPNTNQNSWSETNGLEIVKWADFRSYTLIEFDLSSIPCDATVTSATLKLTRNNNQDGQGSNFDFTARRITGSWTEGGATWNNTSADIDNGTDYGTANGGNDDPDGTQYNLTVTSLVSDWLDGTFTNHGFSVMQDATSGSTQAYFYFYDEGGGADRPELEITYSSLSGTINRTNANTNCDIEGTISITNPTGASNYDYRLNSGTWQSSESFTGLSLGTYDVQIRDADNNTCEKSLGTVTIADVDNDNDCDGVLDITDLDDDNDGILDTDECSSTLVPTLESSVQSISSSGSTDYDVDLEDGSSVNVSSNELFYGGGISQDIPLNSIELPSSNQQANSTTLSANYTITFPDPITELEITFIDFDGPSSETAENFSTTPTSISNNAQESNGVYTSDSSNQDIVLTWNLSSPITSLDFTMTRPTSRLGFAFVSRFDKCLIDRDQDGIIDSKDLDSDGDGCSDANEYYSNGNADGNASGQDTDGFSGLTYGTGTITGSDVDSDGLVNAADYTEVDTGLADARDDTVSDACVFIQTADGNWNDTTKWREKAVPTFNNSATIDDGVTSTVTQDQAVSNLTLDPGSVVEIDDTFTLNVKGNITNNGEFTSSTGTGDGEVVLDGTSNQDLLGDGEYENLRLDNANGADVISSSVINGVLEIDQGTLTTNDDVTFPCDFSSTNNRVGQIGQINGSISGEVITEQCFPARRAFRLISPSTTTTNSSVSTIQANWQEGAGNYQQDPVPNSSTSGNFGYGTHITGINNSETDNSQNNGFDWQPSGNPSMYTFDESAQDWNTVNNTDTNTLTAGDPYRLMIRGDRSVDITDNATTPTNTKLRSTGDPEIGNVQITDIESGPNDEATLIGNPYHSVVNLETVLNNSSGLQDCIIIWDPTLGGEPTVGEPGGRGAFVTVDVSTNTSCNATSEMDKYLQPYQSFFVFSDGSTNPTLNFNENDKATEQSQLSVFSSSPAHYLNVLLYDSSSYMNDKTADDGLTFTFSDNFTNSINSADYLKVGNQDENLATWSENTKLLSMEKRAMPSENDSLQLYTTQYRDSDYVLELETGNFPDNEVYLLDHHTGELTLLNENATQTYMYSVDPSITSSTAWNRFEIVFQNETFGNEDFSKDEIQLYPNPVTDGQFNILSDQLAGQQVEMNISDLNGKRIFNRSYDNFDRLQKVELNNSLSNGVYLITLSSKGEKFTDKLIVH